MVNGEGERMERLFAAAMWWVLYIYESSARSMMTRGGDTANRICPKMDI
jgi:hypothetical protein